MHKSLSISCFLVGLTSYLYPYTQDLFQSMELYWSLYDKEQFQEANKYLDYLIYSEYTPEVDKVHYMMYKQAQYLKDGDIEGAINNKKNIDLLCAYCPECLVEKQKYWDPFFSVPLTHQKSGIN